MNQQQQQQLQHQRQQQQQQQHSKQGSSEWWYSQLNTCENKCRVIKKNRPVTSKIDKNNWLKLF